MVPRTLHGGLGHRASSSATPNFTVEPKAKKRVDGWFGLVFNSRSALTRECPRFRFDEAGSVTSVFDN